MKNLVNSGINVTVAFFKMQKLKVITNIFFKENNNIKIKSLEKILDLNEWLSENFDKYRYEFIYAEKNKYFLEVKKEIIKMIGDKNNQDLVRCYMEKSEFLRTGLVNYLIENEELDKAIEKLEQLDKIFNFNKDGNYDQNIIALNIVEKDKRLIYFFMYDKKILLKEDHELVSLREMLKNPSNHMFSGSGVLTIRMIDERNSWLKKSEEMESLNKKISQKVNERKTKSVQKI